MASLLTFQPLVILTRVEESMYCIVLGVNSSVPWSRRICLVYMLLVTVRTGSYAVSPDDLKLYR